MSPVQTAPAALAAADDRLRAEYLDEVIRLLYPAPCELAQDRGADLVAEYVVVPDARRPRLLVPVGSRRIAAAAVRRSSEPQSRLARFKRDAVAAIMRTGASTLLMRDRIRVAGPAG